MARPLWVRRALRACPRTIKPGPDMGRSTKNSEPRALTQPFFTGTTSTSDQSSWARWATCIPRSCFSATPSTRPHGSRPRRANYTVMCSPRETSSIGCQGFQLALCRWPSARSRFGQGRGAGAVRHRADRNIHPTLKTGLAALNTYIEFGDPRLWVNASDHLHGSLFIEWSSITPRAPRA